MKIFLKHKTVVCQVWNTQAKNMTIPRVKINKSFISLTTIQCIFEMYHNNSVIIKSLV